MNDNDDGHSLELTGRLVPDEFKRKVKPLTLVEKRLINSAADIATYPEHEEVSFLHTLFCQTGMPYRKPTERVWEHANGKVSVRVEAGNAYNPEKDAFVPLPLPYGPKARLVQIHLDSEAIRNQSPNIEVDGSMSAYAKGIFGIRPNGRDIRSLKTQLGALSAATIRLAKGGDHPIQVQTHIVSAFDIWFTKDANQHVLWPSVIKLSSDYYQSLADHAVPLDHRAVAALSHTALGLDIYTWLAQRLHRVNPARPSFVAWANLWDQFGMNYKRINKFREVFLHALAQVQTQYPRAEIAVDGRGLTLSCSPPPISIKMISA